MELETEMSEKDLLETLEQLRAQVAALEADNASKARLESLIGTLEQRLQGTGSEAHHGHLVAELKEAISHFEVEHPRLTRILNDLMVTLSNMGI
jgi:chromosome segregation ATPase